GDPQIQQTQPAQPIRHKPSPLTVNPPCAGGFTFHNPKRKTHRQEKGHPPPSRLRLGPSKREGSPHRPHRSSLGSQGRQPTTRTHSPQTHPKKLGAEGSIDVTEPR